MTRGITFIGQQPWDAIHAAASRARGDVAVAYVGSGASRLLPLRRGSRLVVDASEEAVKGGQTKPHELIAWLIAGVEVFSQPGLHAKVFVFGSQAFIGSTNVSKNSAKHQVEAVLRTADRQAVAAARAFVDDLCRERLLMHDLSRLKKMYRPPLHQPSGGSRPARSALVVVRMNVEPFTETGAEAAEQGRPEAEAAMSPRSRSDLNLIEWPSGCPLPLGTRILPIAKEKTGKWYVSAPSKIIHIHSFAHSRGKGDIVYYEVPRRRRIEESRLAVKLGRGAAKRLKRQGRVNTTWSKRITSAWPR